MAGPCPLRVRQGNNARDSTPLLITFWDGDSPLSKQFFMLRYREKGTVNVPRHETRT